jgi:diguanylate cyclase (GGDEF)-like protein
VRDATHDALTDLYSYRALVERVREEMGQANRAGSSIAMLFVDLDDFKEINDRYGHPTGNEILKGVASVLQQSMRSTDIAGRFGGDEFVVLLVDSDENGAVRVAEQIREGVAGTFVEIPGGKVGTTVSIGVAFHDAATRALTSSDELFAEADASLYIAKAQGGNRVHPAVREGTPQ